MAYTNQHKLLTIHGTLGTSGETWSFGLRIDPTSAVAVTQAQVDAAFTVVKNWYTTASASGGLFPFEHKITYAKLAQVGTDGLYPLDSSPVISTGASAGGGYVTPPARWPWQSAVAITLLTNKPRGLASKGRFYTPPWALPVGPDGLLTTSDCQNAANQVDTMIVALNSVVDLGTVSIFSRGKKLSGSGTTADPFVYGTGETRAVQNVRCGRVVDTIRRRRRQLAEGYVSDTH